MAYVKQNFIDGDVLSAEELNHMEDGISNSLLKDFSNATGGINTDLIENSAVTTSKIANNAISILYTTTIETTDWSQQTDYANVSLTLSGLKTTDKIIIDCNTANISSIETLQEVNEAFGLFLKASCDANDTLTIISTIVPSVDIPIKVLAVSK